MGIKGICIPSCSLIIITCGFIHTPKTFCSCVYTFPKDRRTILKGEWVTYNGALAAMMAEKPNKIYYNIAISLGY